MEPIIEQGGKQVQANNTGHNDIFKEQLEKYSSSKTIKILNFIYSFLVGILSSQVFEKISKGYPGLSRIMDFLQEYAPFFFVENTQEWIWIERMI